MPRARSPDSIEAEKLYNSGMKLVEIAGKLEVPDGTVRRWKSTQRWEEKKSERSDTGRKQKKANVRKRGAPKGNLNAEGHGAPKGNKNSIKTGEFEALFFDTLDADEHALIDAVQMDKEKLLLQEIQLLTVRERRMLKRIEDLKQTAEESGTDKVPSGMSVTKFAAGIEKGHPTDLREYEGILGQIQSIEDALTRVQARKQKAIEALHRFGHDDTRLELENMKLELTMLKQGDTDGDAGEDGFLEAMKGFCENE